MKKLALKSMFTQRGMLYGMIFSQIWIHGSNEPFLLEIAYVTFLARMRFLYILNHRPKIRILTKKQKKNFRRKRFGNVWNFVCLFGQLHLLAFWRIIILGSIAVHKKKTKESVLICFLFFFVIFSELCKMDSCCFSNKWFKYTW